MLKARPRLVQQEMCEKINEPSQTQIVNMTEIRAKTRSSKERERIKKFDIIFSAKASTRQVDTFVQKFHAS